MTQIAIQIDMQNTYCVYDPEGANKETLWEFNIQCDVHKRPNNVHEPRISYEEES